VTVRGAFKKAQKETRAKITLKFEKWRAKFSLYWADSTALRKKRRLGINVIPLIVPLPYFRNQGH